MSATTHSAHAELGVAGITAPCEVKGTAGYLMPRHVTWRVHAYLGRGGEVTVRVTAIVTGLNRKGVSRGAAMFSDDTRAPGWIKPVPEWLDRPDEWIQQAARLVRDAVTPATTGSDDRG